jgi:hypothetical protein
VGQPGDPALANAAQVNLPEEGVPAGRFQFASLSPAWGPIGIRTLLDGTQPGVLLLDSWLHETNPNLSTPLRTAPWLSAPVASRLDLCLLLQHFLLCISAYNFCLGI